MKPFLFNSSIWSSLLQLFDTKDIKEAVFQTNILANILTNFATNKSEGLKQVSRFNDPSDTVDI